MIEIDDFRYLAHYKKKGTSGTPFLLYITFNPSIEQDQKLMKLTQHPKLPSYVNGFKVISLFAYHNSTSVDILKEMDKQQKLLDGEEINLSKDETEEKAFHYVAGSKTNTISCFSNMNLTFFPIYIFR